MVRWKKNALTGGQHELRKLMQEEVEGIWEMKDLNFDVTLDKAEGFPSRGDQKTIKNGYLCLSNVSLHDRNQDGIKHSF